MNEVLMGAQSLHQGDFLYILYCINNYIYCIGFIEQPFICQAVNEYYFAAVGILRYGG